MNKTYQKLVVECRKSLSIAAIYQFYANDKAGREEKKIGWGRT